VSEIQNLIRESGYVVVDAEVNVDVAVVLFDIIVLHPVFHNKSSDGVEQDLSPSLLHVLLVYNT